MKQHVNKHALLDRQNATEIRQEESQAELEHLIRDAVAYLNVLGIGHDEFLAICKATLDELQPAHSEQCVRTETEQKQRRHRH